MRQIKIKKGFEKNQNPLFLVVYEKLMIVTMKIQVFKIMNFCTQRVNYT